MVYGKCMFMVPYSTLKLRFHICVMRMRMTNANMTKNRKHRISIGVLPFVRKWMRSTTATKWILFVAISLNANGLSDRKSLHMHGATEWHALHEGENYTGPWQSFVIHIRRHIRILYKWNVSFGPRASLLRLIHGFQVSGYTDRFMQLVPCA